jgi:hypothetical protein
MSTLVVREIVACSGLDPDRDVTYLAVGGSETRSGAMGAGFVDAALMTIPLNYAPERQGIYLSGLGPGLCALSNERNLRFAGLLHGQP